MKLLSVAIPSYNSQDYLAHAVESVLSAREYLDQLEILIVNDGSRDRTAAIADEFERKYPGVVRAIHKENGGHGDAVMTGLSHAAGRYFKVVDSDDWLDEQELPRVLNTLAGTEVDLFVCNFIYDKAGASVRHVVRYHHAFPQDRIFTWSDTRHFRKGQYMLMHSMIYRTELLRNCGLELPRHTFYVDELYAYVPLKSVQTLYYMDADLYHYFIGREDQSVQEDVMIRRIDQALRVNRLMVTQVDLNTVADPRLRNYMRNYLEIVTTASSALLIRSGTGENLQKKKELWNFIKENNPAVYRELRRRLLGILLHLPGRVGRAVVVGCYKISRKFFGFN